MPMIAYAFLQSRRLKAAGRKKNEWRATAATQYADRQQAMLDIFARPPLRCPHCEMRLTETAKRKVPMSC